PLQYGETLACHVTAVLSAHTRVDCVSWTVPEDWLAHSAASTAMSARAGGGHIATRASAKATPKLGLFRRFMEFLLWPQHAAVVGSHNGSCPPTSPVEVDLRRKRSTGGKIPTARPGGMVGTSCARRRET